MGTGGGQEGKREVKRQRHCPQSKGPQSRPAWPNKERGVGTVREDVDDEEVSGLGAPEDMEKVLEATRGESGSGAAELLLSELGGRRLPPFLLLLTPSARAQVLPQRKLTCWWRSLLLKLLAPGGPFRHISVSF